MFDTSRFKLFMCWTQITGATLHTFTTQPSVIGTGFIIFFYYSMLYNKVPRLLNESSK